MEGLLFILAHPDDETLFAGTIAKYTAAGVPAALVCATRGERGATADLCSIEELPRVREGEVRAAAEIIGIHPTELLPYEDQKLNSVAPEEMRRQLVAVIRRERPRVVVTFDPNGANQHQDHMAISRFAADAVSCAADPRWYPEAGDAHSVRRLLWPPPLAPFKLAGAGDLPNQPGIDFLIDITPFRERKEAAIRAHRTQLPGLRRLYFESDFPMSVEAFRLGWGPRPERRPARDLFAA
jgi:LmbE family N-acetylglucosaminyl deacetylase